MICKRVTFRRSLKLPWKGVFKGDAPNDGCVGGVSFKRYYRVQAVWTWKYLIKCTEM
jgi:hypothetical protein